MIRVELPALGFDQVWRDAARRLASHRIPPQQVTWARGAGGDLFGGTPPPDLAGAHPVRVPQAFAELSRLSLCHRDDQAPALLYQTILRHQSDRAALHNPADPLTRRLAQLARSVRRDIHKMHAFLRFRELPSDAPRRRFAAWFEPDHLIVEAAAGFFARRFADMDWLIATPQGNARFESGALAFDPPGPCPDLPQDASEALWATYFASIFNPARLHVKAMLSEMPKKYWKNLPETRLIPEMIEQAEHRVRKMRAAAPSSAPARAERILARQQVAQQPAVTTLAEAQAAAMGCRRCALCEAATQTVWGEGNPHAPLMIVGEQPGDHEDLTGRPFAGPAGTLLRGLLAEAGISDVWLTNAVKHFKFTPRGKTRLHQNPSRGEIMHCRFWLGLERAFVRPRVTVALGASAAFALTGSPAPMQQRRGTVETATDGGPVIITWHPSFLLRAPPDQSPRLRDELFHDLQAALRLAGNGG